jgi:hypothetical protein
MGTCFPERRLETTSLRVGDDILESCRFGSRSRVVPAVSAVGELALIEGPLGRAPRAVVRAVLLNRVVETYEIHG